ncbi:MAG TPA: hypothetical protein DGG95_04425 [Cytophagales bacterium]|nr:hypothetical protein [Cytophagales bacterium]
MNDPEKDIEAIRSLMERSVKFLSLSGLSGILSGVYASVGAAIAYYLLYYPRSVFQYRIESIQDQSVLTELLIVAMIVLAASLVTGYQLSKRKAQKVNMSIWNPTSRRLMLNLATPLFTGGIFILILLYNGQFGIAAPACLIFYGLALLNASDNLFDEIRYLAYSEIVVGLLGAAFPGYGLLLWFTGFGLLHIVYGAMMYKKYDA